MNTFNPDTYCGLYCGACSIAMHGKTASTDKFAACLGSVPKEDLICGGCKSDMVYFGCSICTLRSCAREKNVEHCTDCSDYPCKSYIMWQRMTKLLPHIHEAESGLEAIKHNGVEHWIDSQKKRWSCSSCGTPFSWYTSMCSKCDRHLLPKAYNLSGWRKLFCKFVLPMVYRKGKARSKSV